MQIGVQFKKDLTEITESLKNEKNAHDRKELGLGMYRSHWWPCNETREED